MTADVGQPESGFTRDRKVLMMVGPGGAKVVPTKRFFEERGFPGMPFEPKSAVPNTPWRSIQSSSRARCAQLHARRRTASKKWTGYVVVRKFLESVTTAESACRDSKRRQISMHRAGCRAKSMHRAETRAKSRFRARTCPRSRVTAAHAPSNT